MCTRQPYFSGIRESSEIAASMPASLRGAPFGVPVVPEVRMMIRLWPPGTGSGLSSRSASISESRVSDPDEGPVSPSAHDSTRLSTSAFSSMPVNSSSWTTTLGSSRSRTSTSWGPAKAVLR